MKPLQSPGSIVPPRPHEPWLRCYECGQLIHGTGNVVDFYLRGQAGVCPACSAQLDWWTVAVRMIQGNFMAFEAFYPLGAKQTLFQTKIFRDTITRYDLYEEGLPRNAVLLDVNLSPEGMFCTEVTGNNRRLRNKGGHLDLRGFHTYTSVEHGSDEATVNILVTWVESSQDDSAWSSLVAAFDYYVDGNYEATLVPANVAVESRLFRLLQNHLSLVAGKKRVQEFLESGATYAHQLNILLPLVVKYLGGPVLPGDLRGRLNRLRDLRNDVAHLGRCEPSLSKGECAELIAAALFGFRYLAYVGSFEKGA